VPQCTDADLDIKTVTFERWLIRRRLLQKPDPPAAGKGGRGQKAATPPDTVIPHGEGCRDDTLLLQELAAAGSPSATAAGIVEDLAAAAAKAAVELARQVQDQAKRPEQRVTSQPVERDVRKRAGKRLREQEALHEREEEKQIQHWPQARPLAPRAIRRAPSVVHAAATAASRPNQWLALFPWAGLLNRAARLHRAPPSSFLLPPRHPPPRTGTRCKGPGSGSRAQGFGWGFGGCGDAFITPSRGAGRTRRSPSAAPGL
jgi:hypothetical protein